MENLRVFHDTPFSLSAPPNTASAARVSECGPELAVPSLSEEREAFPPAVTGEERGVDGAGVQSAVWDVRGQRWFLVTRDCRLFCVCCTTHRVLFQRSLVHMEGIPAPDAVAHAALLQFQDALFLAFAKGDLLLLHLPPPLPPSSAAARTTQSAEGAPGPWGGPTEVHQATPAGAPGAGEGEGAWGSLEVVGEVKGGAVAAAWSPSEDCLALVSGEGKLLCMTSDWDVTAEVDFLPPGPHPAGGGAAASLAPGSVSISWRGDGAFFATSHVTSHESQPHDGTSAAAAPSGRMRVWATGTCALHSQSDELLSAHQGQPRGAQGEGRLGSCFRLPVAWQPSGALIAVGCSQKSNSSGPPGLPGVKPRQTQSGRPGHTSGRPSLGGSGAARGAPSSDLGPQQASPSLDGGPALGAGLEVALLERNGMLRSSFPLQAPRGTALLALAWSSDSRVLAVTLRCAAPGRCAFQLYHRVNYRWYLKHEWRAPAPGCSLGVPRHLASRAPSHAGYDAGAGLEWHPERPLDLLLWGPRGAPSHTQSRPSADHSVPSNESALPSVETGAATSESAVLRHVRLHWESACPLDVAASGRGSVAAVVDGARVLVTDFASTLIPPPMCSRELRLPAPVRTAAVLGPSLAPLTPGSLLTPHTPPSSNPNSSPTSDRGHPGPCNGITEGGGASKGEGSSGEGKLVAVLADGSLCLVTGPGAGGVSEEEEEDMEEEMQEDSGRREKEQTGAPEASTSASADTGSHVRGGRATVAGAPVVFKRTVVRHLVLRSLLQRGAEPTRAKALPSTYLHGAQHICWLTRNSVLIALTSTDAEPLLHELGAGGAQAQWGQLPGSGPSAGGSVLVEAAMGEGEEEAHRGDGKGDSGSSTGAEASPGCAYIVQCTRTPYPLVALASTSHPHSVPQTASSGTPQTHRPSALVHLRDGEVLEYAASHPSGPPAVPRSHSASQGELRPLGRLPAVCPWLAAAQIPSGTPMAHRGPAQEGGGALRGAGAGGSRDTPGVCMVGLSESRQLFVGQHCIASDCTSFLLLSLPSPPQAPIPALRPSSAEALPGDTPCVPHRGSSGSSSSGTHWLKHSSGVMSAGGGVTSSSAAASLTVAYTTASGFLVCRDLDWDGAPAGDAPDLEAARKALEGGPGRGAREALKGVDPRVLPVHERGARLAGALGAADPGLVLLAPRGNLEAVYPRWLVLKGLGSALLRGSFLEAFQLARRHRLDLNVLVDFWGWPLFARHVAPPFVAQVAAEDVRLLSELVCCLRAEDSCREWPYGALSTEREAHVYGALFTGLTAWGSAANSNSSAHGAHPPSVPGAPSAPSEQSGTGTSQELPELDVNVLFRDLELEEGSSSHSNKVRKVAGPVPEEMGKVTAVCAAIREALLLGGTPQEHRGLLSSPGVGAASAAEELCVLTTYACSDPPLLEEALGIVRAARDWELQNQQHQNQQHKSQQNQKHGAASTAVQGSAAEGKMGRHGSSAGSVAEAVGAVLGGAGPGVGREESGSGVAGEDVTSLLPVGPASSVTKSTGTVTKSNNSVTEDEALSTDCRSKGPSGPVLSAEASLKHLMWLTSADRVLDAALGLYDLPLAALAVVHHPSKDPREHFPLLQGLARLPLPLMRFRIDVRLGRLERAVHHLADALRALPRCTNGTHPQGSGDGSIADAGVALPSLSEPGSLPAAVPSAGSSRGTEGGSGKGEESEEEEREEDLGAGLPAVYQSCLRECLALIQAHPARLFPVAASAFRHAPGAPGNPPAQDHTPASRSPSLSPSSALPAEGVRGAVGGTGAAGNVLGRVRRAVVEQWGAYLESQELHPEAALAYLAARRPLRALAAYRAGGNWRPALGVARSLRWGPGRVKALAAEMREELVALGKKAEGGRIAAEYEGDAVTAVGLLVEAQQWEEAVHVGYARDRADLVASLVVPAALAAADSLVSEFTETQAKIRAYLVRHQLVRQRRLALARRVEEAEAEGWGDGDDETASTTASTLSTASGLTNLSAYASRAGPSGAGSSAASTSGAGSVSGASATTAGGRRPSGRAEKRAAAKQRKAKGGGRIRAGSPGEELAIVEHLRALAPPASVRAEVGQLLQVLVGAAMAEDAARKLQRCLQTLLKMHSRALRFLRDQGAEGAGQGQGGGAGGAPEGEGQTDSAAWKWRLLEA